MLNFNNYPISNIISFLKNILTKYKNVLCYTAVLSPFLTIIYLFRRELFNILYKAIADNNYPVSILMLTVLVFLVILVSFIRENVVRLWEDRPYSPRSFFLGISLCILLLIITVGLYWYSTIVLGSALLLGRLLALVFWSDSGFGTLQHIGDNSTDFKPPVLDKSLGPHFMVMDNQSDNGSTGNNITESPYSNLRVSYALGDKPTKYVEVPNNAVLFPTNNTEEKALNGLNNERNSYDIIAAKSLADVMDDLIEKKKVPEEETIIFRLIPRFYKVSVDTINSTLNKYPEGSKEWRLARLQLQAHRSQELSSMKEKLMSECEGILSKHYPGFDKDPSFVSYRNSLNRHNEARFVQDERCNNITSELINKIKSEKN